MAKIKRTPDEIERASNRLLSDKLDYFFRDKESKIRPYPLHELKEKGIDFIVEIEPRFESQMSDLPTSPKGTFYIQNKGTDTQLVPLVKGKEKGKISFQLDHYRQVKYFAFELDQPMIITICDLKGNTIYWSPIQLEAEKYLDKIEEIAKGIDEKSRKTAAIQIYIDPTNYICKNNKTHKKNFERFLEDIKYSKDLLHDRYADKSIQYYTFKENDSYSPVIDRTKPILQQLYDYVCFRTNEIISWPHHLFTRNYPFALTEHKYPNFSTNVLSTDNEELFEFFDTLPRSEKGVIELPQFNGEKQQSTAPAQIKAVLKKMNDNLIFYLQHKSSRKRISVRYQEDERCECVRCCFQRFEFSKAFKLLNKAPNDINDEFLKAYVHYQVGNFIDAAEVLLKLVESTNKENLKILNFIACFNLSMLNKIIRSQFIGKDSHDILLDKLSKINLDKKIKQSATEGNSKLLEWIKNDKFYSDAREKINKAAENIKDHYYSQLRGGWSSNNHIQELCYEYDAIATFIMGNYIFFDVFTEFKVLTEKFIEGLIASHAINENQQSRLGSFNDGMIASMILYGKADSILTFADRYRVMEFKYNKSSSSGQALFDLTINFFEGYVPTRWNFEKYCKNNIRHFWNRYNEIFCNLLVINGLCKLKADQVNFIAEKLLKFINEENAIYPYNIKYLRFFIRRKGEVLEKDILARFLSLSIKKEKLHENSFIDTVTEQLVKHHGEINLTMYKCKLFESIFISTCPKCNTQHPSTTLVYLYSVANDYSIKKRIKGKIIQILNTNFDSDLFYTSAIYDVIDLNNDWLNMFIEIVKPSLKKKSFGSFFSGMEENRISVLNMLINLCYKYDIDLCLPTYDAFRNYDPYYDWLLDMKSFDYKLFNPKWVTEYPTLFYHNQIKKHLIIKQKISEFLNSQKDPQLERDYFELFCKPT